MQVDLDAADRRVRPVFLEVLTTVLGVIPLLWDPSLNSLAVEIFCGLSCATVLTLIIVPTLYAIFFNAKNL
jgi:multidrug efflux pump subunit AcrB